MIVTSRISLVKLLGFTWRNLSVLVVWTLFASVSSLFIDMEPLKGLSFPAGFLGTALAFLIGFRNNAAYDRWWEARKVWGKLVNDSRLFSLRVLGLLSAPSASEGQEGDLHAVQQAMTYRHCAFVWALDKHLRRQDPWDAIAPFLEAGEIERLQIEQNVPLAILRSQEIALKRAFEAGYTDPFRLLQIEALMENFNDALGMNERIKNTPFPRQYGWFMSYALSVFLLVLPFSLQAYLGWLSIPVSLGIGYVYIMIEYVGRHIETPFENTVDDIPMDALSRTIEINLRQNLGETELPPAIESVGLGYLY